MPSFSGSKASIFKTRGMDTKQGTGSGDTGIKRPVILYIFPSESSFVKNDMLSLADQYELRTFIFLPPEKYMLPLYLIKEKLFLLKNIFSSSLVVCQFAGYHSLLPVLTGRLMKRPVCIIVGGTDCISMASAGYGNLRKPLLGWFTLKSLKWAKQIISPGESLIECEYNYTDADYPRQGYRSFDRSITTPVSVIYNGVNTGHFNIKVGKDRRKNSFLTVCTTIDKRNYRLKGLDLFVKASEHFPEYTFTIIGRLAPGFYFNHPPNVTVLSYVEHELLPAKMAEHMFYCQLSMSEGFGVALAEAMSCGCVPIVSRVGIMDFIVGDTGFILDKYDLELLFGLIERAVGSDTKQLGLEASRRVKENFSIEIRSSRFTSLIGKLIRTIE
jgi:glycosyltransferase involved in cell wall biosynthesis